MSLSGGGLTTFMANKRRSSSYPHVSCQLFRHSNVGERSLQCMDQPDRQHGHLHRSMTSTYLNCKLAQLGLLVRRISLQVCNPPLLCLSLCFSTLGLANDGPNSASDSSKASSQIVAQAYELIDPLVSNGHTPHLLTSCIAAVACFLRSFSRCCSSNLNTGTTPNQYTM